MHLGTNELNISSPSECSESMVDLCNTILKKNSQNTTLISKAFPKLEGRKVIQDIMKFNWEVENHCIDNDRVTFSAND